MYLPPPIANLKSLRARSLLPRYLSNQTRQTDKPHGQAAVRSGERALDVIANHQVVALWVGTPERLQVAGVEIRRGPLAFDHQRGLFSAGEDEIDLVAALVTPSE